MTDEAINAIAHRHGLRFRSWMPLAQVGIINTIYSLGDSWILRVPRNHQAHIEQTQREAIAVPARRYPST